MSFKFDSPDEVGSWADEQNRRRREKLNPIALMNEYSRIELDKCLSEVIPDFQGRARACSIYEELVLNNLMSKDSFIDEVVDWAIIDVPCSGDVECLVQCIEVLNRYANPRGLSFEITGFSNMGAWIILDGFRWEIGGEISGPNPFDLNDFDHGVLKYKALPYDKSADPDDEEAELELKLIEAVQMGNSGLPVVLDKMLRRHFLRAVQ